MRRTLLFLVHNWPLKIAAIGLATLLYAGFVVSRDSETLPGPIPILPVGLPEDATLTDNLPAVSQIRYTVVGTNVGALTADAFRAEVDLSGVQRDVPVPVTVRVRPLIGGVIVTSVTPSTINVTVESVEEKEVRVEIVPTEVPPDVDLGTLVVTPNRVVVRGARSLVALVDHVTATVPIEPAALDIDRAMQPFAVDANGAPVTGVTVAPRTVRVQLPVINDKESKQAVPITPTWEGEPAPGYHVTGVAFEPSSVAVVGDADDLAALEAVQTNPIDISGETASLTRVVGLAVPQGLSIPNVDQVTVRVTIEVATDNRTFNAGIELVGRDPALLYDFPIGPVAVALFGPVLDLDELATAPLLVQLDVTGLGPGTHTVTLRPQVPSSLQVASSSPASVAVTITAVPASASPSPGSSPAP